MCDTIECMEIITTILNKYIPEILPTLENYVVKGGKASDFYISHNTGKELIRFTDWDLACNSEESQTIIKNKILDYLDKQGILNIKQQKIVAHDGKKGLQIGIECAGEECFFVDIVIYSPDDSIFIDNTINGNVRYVNINYLLNDLQQTYSEREDRLSEELDTFNITGIDSHNITNDISYYMNQIREQLILNRKIKASSDICKINQDKSLEEEEKKEYIDEIINIDINELISEILPSFRNSIEKLLRTKDRLQKIREIADRNYKKGGKKTIKNKKWNKIRRNTRRK